MLTKEQILQKRELKTKVIKVPEWGGEVIIRELTGAERDQLEMESIDIKNGVVTPNYKNQRARIIQKVLVDEKGKSLFKRNEIEALGETSAAGLETIYKAVQKMNGLTEREVDNSIENFSEVTGENSSSG